MFGMKSQLNNRVHTAESLVWTRLLANCNWNSPGQTADVVVFWPFRESFSLIPFLLEWQQLRIRILIRGLQLRIVLRLLVRAY